MAKKVAFSVLSVLIVAALVAGVYFFANDKDTDTATPQSVEVITEEFLDEDLEHENYIIDDSTDEDSDYVDEEDEFSPPEDNLADNTDDIVTTNFSIAKIVDHTTSQEVHPRVVFGSGYNVSENYIKFDSDSNFEMYLSGYFNNITKGVYKEYEDVIFVEYSDGTAAEYDIKHNDSGTISYIIVNYGDYDIYFS